MRTALISHSACLQHQPPQGHPEHVGRLAAILTALDAPGFEALERRMAPRADREALLRAHSAEAVARVEAAAPNGDEPAGLDPDTWMSSGSLEAALRAAGAVIAAVDGVIAGDFETAFCAVRPPGHHAERNRAMGFCLFNNAAIGALHARAVHGLDRVAVVDFDVHHGNGVQDIAWDDPDFFYASIHQGGIYPMTGRAEERGAHGNVVNAPAPAGCEGPRWRDLFEADVLPALDAFAPSLVIISAGFDAHREDPLAGLALTEDDFAWATERLVEAARRSADARLVSTLEGGYDLPALAACAAAHVRVLMEA